MTSVDEGLGAVGHVDDGEALVADHRAIVGVDPAPVRPAMAQALDVGDSLLPQLYGVSLDVEDGEDSAHLDLLSCSSGNNGRSMLETGDYLNPRLASFEATPVWVHSFSIRACGHAHGLERRDPLAPEVFQPEYRGHQPRIEPRSQILAVREST